jgi:ABC-2 type transport system permease protein
MADPRPTSRLETAPPAATSAHSGPTARIDRMRLLAVARKEWTQFRRDPRSLILAFALPVLLLLLFGYAITWDVRNISMVIVDQDHTAMSRTLGEAFTSSGYFHLAGRLDRTAEIAGVFERSAARIALVIPAGFASDAKAGRSAPLQVLADGSDANTATIALSYVEAVVQAWAAKNVRSGLPVQVPLVAETRVWFNEELASRNMIVPGLVAVIMAIIAAMLTSLTIAREWERGTMEQLIATPVTRVEVVAGKLVPYLVVGMVDVAITTLLGVTLFHVPFRGDVLLFLVLSLLFLTGALGLGMFISAAARSQVLATQIAMIATFLPAFLLSGFMFSIEAMPAPLRLISLIVPARYFLVVTRGLFLKGIGIDVLWLQAVFMLVFAVIGLALAVRSFRKELQS